MENSRGLVSLASISDLLPQILGGPVTYHESSRRLYIGGVGVHFTAHLNNGNPPSLVMDFTSPVNPRIATEPGKVHMLFTREPLVPPSSLTLTFDSKTIPAAAYQEANGAAEITISAHVPLFASFSNDGRTITLSPAPQQTHAPEATNPPPAVQPAATPPAAAAQPATAPAPPPPPPVPIFAVVDASHGGDERGAALTDQLAERDVTLAFASRLQQALQAKGIPTLALREGNATLSLEQRAILTNQAHPRIYICLHASSVGKGVRLYTGLVPPGAENSGRFLNWDTAQTAFLPLSRTLATRVAAQLRSQQLAVLSFPAPLRPLNNIAAPAIAIELAPPPSGIADINSSAYQDPIANGVATAIAAIRASLEEKP